MMIFSGPLDVIGSVFFFFLRNLPFDVLVKKVSLYAILLSFIFFFAFRVSELIL